MKIGYPCLNRSLDCTPNGGFILKNYSEKNVKEKTAANLSCLKKILAFNAEKNLLFFRLSSDLVPFASHPVMKFDWQEHFEKDFLKIGTFIKEKGMRISMHPDQFVLLNSPREDVFEKSVMDLKWHCEALDLMELDDSAKVQIHVGGVYGDKKSALKRFLKRYAKLPGLIKRRLAIENDDRLYGAADCLYLHSETGIPVIFDCFHHKCLNNGETLETVMKKISGTWKKKDGVMMADYSSQAPGGRRGSHAETLDLVNFSSFIKKTRDLDFDLMLEIKDKEKSAIKAKKIIDDIRRKK